MRRPKETSNSLFDRFWKAYPRKESKPQALRTFSKLRIDEETLERILREIERQSRQKDWEHIAPKYIPMASTWLNRRDWEENHDGENSFDDTGNTSIKYGNALY